VGQNGNNFSNMNERNKTYFAPQHYIKNGVKDVDFCVKAFGAIELRCFSNDDGSIHVSELSNDDAIFHLHEVTANLEQFEPNKFGGVTALIGLLVKDVDAVISRAVEAGAVVKSPAQSYDYGYRQGEIRDPFGYIWMIEKKI
jgi:PhnB protein